MQKVKRGEKEMSRTEKLQQEREKILNQISQGTANKAKLLTALMDIDDEIELSNKRSKLVRS